MREHFDFVVTERIENHARLLLAPREGSNIREITGVVRGPYSNFSKTLTADSTFKSAPTTGIVEALVVEPCYWTPQLPFWYDLRLSLTAHDGSTRDEVIPVSLIRFYCERRNFLLEGRRVVLRGMTSTAPTNEQLVSAREHETALIVKQPSPHVCEAASRLGVPLLVDLRDAELSTDLLHMLDWYPAMTLVLATADRVETVSLRNVYAAVCVDATHDEPKVRCDVYAIKLEPGERPPQWVTTCNKPVIVIRKDPNADIRTARAGCDKLQAELAPEFNLAGYFV